MSKGAIIVFYMCTIAIFSTCKKEEASVIMVDNGTWKVTYKSDNGNDQTDHFSAYTFRFEKNGTAIANSNTGTATGSWSAGYDDDHLKFRPFFGPSPLNELNEDWEVVSEDGRVVQLRHIGGGTDFLTFQKQ